MGTESRACYELAQKRLTNAENLNKLIERADERTQTAFLLITSDNSGVAGDCKCRIFREVSFPCLAECCTVLRSRWCQSGVNIALAAAARASLRSPWFLDPSPVTQINSALAGAYHTLGRGGESHRHGRVVCRVPAIRRTA